MLCRRPIYHLNAARKQCMLINKRPIRPCNIQVRAIPQDIETISYFVGKSVILFTMFYCTLNWHYYRTQRKQQEKHDNKDNNKKD